MILLSHDHPDATHVTCCDDDDMSLCARDMSEVPWTEDPATCAPCAHLEGTSYCPKNIRCRLPAGTQAYSNPEAAR